MHDQANSGETARYEKPELIDTFEALEVIGDADGLAVGAVGGGSRIVRLSEPE